MRTSLLIPCYNEVEGIPRLCERLKSILPLIGPSGEVEVLFVNDGSTDGTADAIRRYAAELPYRLLTHERNRGIGAALKTGFAATDADQIVTMDSDCTYDPMHVPGILALLQDGNDIVTGSPYHPLGGVAGVPGWRLLLSKSLSRIYWIILPQRLYTYTSCFRAYRSEVLAGLRAGSDGFLCVTQLLISGILNGARVAEYPAQLTQRQFGRSKIKIARVILSHLLYMGQVVVERFSGYGERAPGLSPVLKTKAGVTTQQASQLHPTPSGVSASFESSSLSTSQNIRNHYGPQDTTTE